MSSVMILYLMAYIYPEDPRMPMNTLIYVMPSSEMLSSGLLELSSADFGSS